MRLSVPHPVHKGLSNIKLSFSGVLPAYKRLSPLVALTDSHGRNKELIEQLIRGNGVLQVARIFFNDDDIDGAEPLSGHSNHIHVQFKLP